VTDYTPAADLATVVDCAAGFAEAIREPGPHTSYRAYGRAVELCALRPAFAAQVLMTFAVLFDPDEITTKELDRRADNIIRRRTA